MESNNPAILDLIARYKAHVREHGMKDEVYKWELIQRFRGRPDPDAKDFSAEIASLSFSNLGYGFAVSALKRMARERPEPTRQAIKILLDEQKPLTERIPAYVKSMQSTFREIEPNDNRLDYQDERMAGLLLAYHTPQHYPIYKANLYDKLCAELQLKTREPGARYAHYVELLQEIAQNYLQQDHELQHLHKEHLKPELMAADPGFLLMAQNMLYLVFEGSNAVGYWLFQCNPDYYDIVGALRSTAIDEWQVTSYKKDIKPGDRIIIWVTGETAGCYALAIATTEPSERQPASDYPFQLSPEYLSKESVGIEITHNFGENPIHWAALRHVKGFEDLKRGRMGTNFPSSRRTYEFLKGFHAQVGVSGRNIWLLTVGKKETQWQQFQEEGIAGISFPTGDLRSFPDKESLRAKIRLLSENDGSKKNDTNACWDFLHSMKPGDIIIPKKRHQCVPRLGNSDL